MALRHTDQMAELVLWARKLECKANSLYELLDAIVELGNKSPKENGKITITINEETLPLITSAQKDYVAVFSIDTTGQSRASG